MQKKTSFNYVIYNIQYIRNTPKSKSSTTEVQQQKSANPTLNRYSLVWKLNCGFLLAGFGCFIKFFYEMYIMENISNIFEWPDSIRMRQPTKPIAKAKANRLADCNLLSLISNLLGNLACNTHCINFELSWSARTNQLNTYCCSLLPDLQSIQQVLLS